MSYMMHKLYIRHSCNLYRTYISYLSYIGDIIWPHSAGPIDSSAGRRFAARRSAVLSHVL